MCILIWQREKRMNDEKKLPELWAHQVEAIKKAHLAFALFFDPGTGKSWTAIEIFKKFLIKLPNNKLERQKLLILAPLNVCRNWENELAKFLGQPYETFLIAGHTKAKRVKTLEKYKRLVLKNKHLILISNIEVMRSEDNVDLLIECQFDSLIVDESHNFKTPPGKSKQTKGLLRLKKETALLRLLLLLTGTPAPQGEIDLWSTFTLLNQTTDSFFVWRKKHFDDKNEARRGTKHYWPQYNIRDSSREEFQKLLSERSMSAEKDEVLDLPPLLRTNIYAEMSAKQARHYETMKEFLFAIDEDGNELNASNLLVRTLRLQQILAGFIGDEPIKDNSRLKALDSAIEKTNGEQFIVWTIFKATYGQIAKVLDDKGLTFGRLTGIETAQERFDNIEDFQSGKLRALIAHPKAGGVGINLTAAPYSIHYTRSYSLVDYLQSVARNYRGGSEVHKRITRIEIVTPRTIDEDITEALIAKKSTQDFILGLKEKR